MDKLVKSPGLDPGAAKAYCQFDPDWGYQYNKEINVDKQIVQKIATEVSDRFNIRLVSDQNRNGRDFISFHVMDLMNASEETLDGLTEYLKGLKEELNAVYVGWYEAKFEFIYE